MVQLQFFSTFSLLVAVVDFNLGSVPAVPPGLQNWQSQLFVLPTPFNSCGVKCQRYSKYACLYKYQFLASQSDRPSSSGDRRAFEALVRPSFEGTTGSPSKHEHAHPQIDCAVVSKSPYSESMDKVLGVSPIDYFNLITDVSDDSSKLLNFIYAEYSDSLCSNIISAVGYGEGNVMYRGRVSLERPFLLPVNMARDFYIIPYDRFRALMNFRWFKEEFLCRDQPWMCNNEQTNNDGDSDSDSDSDSSEETDR
ncbi:uncharacterized protein LOC134856158 [Symsagittifera roscoffensis]|uniref:uncharacterized protein LOC134856158 n=1 Tax=Symsagittifera roscoffensis TaxID=84072 RepID=UPI00307BACBC